MAKILWHPLTIQIRKIAMMGERMINARSPNIMVSKRKKDPNIVKSKKTIAWMSTLIGR